MKTPPERSVIPVPLKSNWALGVVPRSKLPHVGFFAEIN
jgi:hypothetical protein